MTKSINELLDIMRRLRDPDGGCPWDLEQNFDSIAPYTLEEAYEVADAIERRNMEDLRDELGDLLLQVVFHSQMAEEQGSFSFADVVESICDKMTRRHPHVFADAVIEDAHTQTQNWEEIKASERAAKSTGTVSQSLLASVPNNLPGLLRAKKLTKKAASVGFDWPDVASVFEKVDEELLELQEAIDANNSVEITEEYGDLLFALANVARKLDLDPESSLRKANQKFIQRFKFIESQLAKKSQSLENTSLEEMDALWDFAKTKK